jgi:hypothetical protein
MCNMEAVVQKSASFISEDYMIVMKFYTAYIYIYTLKLQPEFNFSSYQSNITHTGTLHEDQIKLLYISTENILQRISI